MLDMIWEVGVIPGGCKDEVWKEEVYCSHGSQRRGLVGCMEKHQVRGQRGRSEGKDEAAPCIGGAAPLNGHGREKRDPHGTYSFTGLV